MYNFYLQRYYEYLRDSAMIRELKLLITIQGVACFKAKNRTFGKVKSGQLHFHILALASISNFLWKHFVLKRIFDVLNI